MDCRGVGLRTDPESNGRPDGAGRDGSGERRIAPAAEPGVVGGRSGEPAGVAADLAVGDLADLVDDEKGGAAVGGAVQAVRIERPTAHPAHRAGAMRHGIRGGASEHVVLVPFGLRRCGTGHSQLQRPEVIPGRSGVLDEPVRGDGGACLASTSRPRAIGRCPNHGGGADSCQPVPSGQYPIGPLSPSLTLPGGDGRDPPRGCNHVRVGGVTGIGRRSFSTAYAPGA